MAANTQASQWKYKTLEEIGKRNLHVEVIADYGGDHSTDHAFSEVVNHFYRFDTEEQLRVVTEHPVYAFSTIETGFWIAQEALHSQHPNLVVFSNTAPRGDIKWHGEQRQAFVCAMLDNGIPVFAVNAGYNLSFIKEHIVGAWEVVCPNIGTQFRSRDYYPEGTMSILKGDMSKVGPAIDISKIPDPPKNRVASIDGYGNIKTSTRWNELPEEMAKSKVVRIRIAKRSFLVLNTLVEGVHGDAGDLCLVLGSSGGRNRNFVEVIQMMGRAGDEFRLVGPKDDLGDIEFEAVV
jgi:hypothetical protein